jgi:hypothetical protein
MSNNDGDLFGGVDTSGLSHVAVQMKDVMFGINPKITDDDGNPVPGLVYTEVRDNGTSQEDQYLSIGGGYVIKEGGARVEHSNARYNGAGDKAGLSTNSKAQTIVDDLVNLDRASVVRHFETTGHGPRHSDFWEGLSFFKVLELVEFGKPDIDGKRKSFKQVRATEFYGWDGFPGQGEGNGANGSSGGGSTTAGNTGSASPLDISEEVVSLLTPLAKEHGSYTDFLDAAYQLDEIADEAVHGVVDDERVYNQLRKG